MMLTRCGVVGEDKGYAHVWGARFSPTCCISVVPVCLLAPIAGHLPGVEAAHEVHGPAGALLALARALLRGGAVRLLLLLGDA